MGKGYSYFHQSLNFIAIEFMLAEVEYIVTARIRCLRESNVFTRVCLVVSREPLYHIEDPPSSVPLDLFKLVHHASPPTMAIGPSPPNHMGTPWLGSFPQTCWQVGGWSSTERPSCLRNTFTCLILDT